MPIPRLRFRDHDCYRSQSSTANGYLAASLDLLGSPTLEAQFCTGSYFWISFGSLTVEPSPILVLAVWIFLGSAALWSKSSSIGVLESRYRRMRSVDRHECPLASTETVLKTVSRRSRRIVPLFSFEPNSKHHSCRLVENSGKGKKLVPVSGTSAIVPSLSRGVFICLPVSFVFFNLAMSSFSFQFIYFLSLFPFSVTAWSTTGSDFAPRRRCGWASPSAKRGSCRRSRRTVRRSP